MQTKCVKIKKVKLKKHNRRVWTIRYLTIFSNSKGTDKYYIKLLANSSIMILIIIGVFVPIVVSLGRLNLPSPIGVGISIFLFCVFYDITGRITGLFSIDWNPFLFLHKRPPIMALVAKERSFKGFVGTLWISFIIALITSAAVLFSSFR